MPNPLQNQMACLLTASAKEWLKTLDKKSDLYRELKGEDVDSILKDNIHKVCAEMTFAEMCKAIALAARLAARGEQGVQVEKEIKSIARDVVKRVEKKCGGFVGPAGCRAVLYDFLEMRRA